jgi:sugar/nucleoside kinase (ribokinase family)
VSVEETPPPLDLLVVGDVNPDVVVSGVGAQIRFGQVEEVVEHAALVLGGSGAIVAMGAARLGLRVGLCAVVGTDDAAALVLQQLVERGVDVAHIASTTSAPTGMTVILDRAGDRAVLTSLGSIPLLSPELLDELGDVPARHVHVASFQLMSREYRAALPGVLRRWRDHGVTTSLDPNWDPQGAWDLETVLAQTDVFLPNEAELAAIGGTPIVDRAMQAVAALGCDVVVKRGTGGAAALVDGTVFRLSRTPPVDFVDAVGAGDSFDAGYLCARITGADVATSLATAVVTGTLSTAATGGTDAQPDRSEVEPWVHRLAPMVTQEEP